MLSLERVNSWYGEAQVLHDVKLNVQEGEIVALFGRNGVGKTTTLRSIMGLAPPLCKGQIMFNNENILGLPPYKIANKGIGYVPEDRRVFPYLTLKKNLDTGKKTLKFSDNVKATWNYKEVFKVFPKLETLQNSLGKNLSGGEQQMLTIARTLMGNPELLILDEPSEGLAPLIAQDVINLVLRLKKEYGLSILIVEQFSPKVLEYADRCYVMDMGRIVFEGPSEEFKKNIELQKQLCGV
jgi:branched-chain amino acid transport system ATP-binding protein